MSNEESPPAVQRRTSIDVYRGMIMFLMLAEIMHLFDLAEHFPGNQLLEWLKFHTTHVAWEGCSLHDLIQPGFTFLVGVAMPFSIASRLKREYREVPFWVILNPASGPGSEVNANYSKAIDRLIGSGCQVLGYVATGYGKTSIDNVKRQMQDWQTMYPRVQGIFFDEMIYEDTTNAVDHQQRVNRIARQMGYWPTVGNAGSDTPGRYFSADCADVIVVHESSDWPTNFEQACHRPLYRAYSTLSGDPSSENTPAKVKKPWEHVNFFSP